MTPHHPPPSPPGQARSASSGAATQSLETQFIFDPPISPNVKEQVSDIEKKGGAQESCGMTPLDGRMMDPLKLLDFQGRKRKFRNQKRRKFKNPKVKKLRQTEQFTSKKTFKSKWDYNPSLQM